MSFTSMSLLHDSSMPSCPVFYYDSIRAYRQTGLVYLTLQQYEDASNIMIKVPEMQQSIAERFGADEQQLRSANEFSRSLVQMQTQPNLVEEEARTQSVIIQILERLHELTDDDSMIDLIASSHQRVLFLMFSTGRFDEAENEYNASICRRQEYLDLVPDDNDALINLATMHSNFGEMRVDKQLWSEAVPYLTRAIEVLETIVESPEVTPYDQLALCRVFHLRAKAYRETD